MMASGGSTGAITDPRVEHQQTDHVGRGDEQLTGGELDVLAPVF